MKALLNKRDYVRFNLEVPIMYASEENRYAFYGAKVLNYSMGGLCFETLYPLQQGTVIFIRKADHAPEAKISSKYTEHLAEVKWCREIVSEDKRTFGTGVMLKTLVADGKPFFINGHSSC